jgi:sec-independent protein translocase protein TatB
MSMPGFWELAMLALLAVLIFGPDRLPGVLRNLGRTVGTVRREAHTALNELKTASDFDELTDAAKELREEADGLRRESREATRALSDTGRRGAPTRSRRPSRPGSTGGAGSSSEGESESGAADAGGVADAPAPFDPDAP